MTYVSTGLFNGYTCGQGFVFHPFLSELVCVLRGELARRLPTTCRYLCCRHSDRFSPPIHGVLPASDSLLISHHRSA